MTLCEMAEKACDASCASLQLARPAQRLSNQFNRCVRTSPGCLIAVPSVSGIVHDGKLSALRSFEAVELETNSSVPRWTQADRVFDDVEVVYYSASLVRR